MLGLVSHGARVAEEDEATTAGGEHEKAYEGADETAFGCDGCVPPNRTAP
mgnify:CR=1 FL=1